MSFFVKFFLLGNFNKACHKQVEVESTDSETVSCIRPMLKKNSVSVSSDSDNECNY